jgi:imidazoleglycerol-phosphate dehydratase / histidinol-phosphatase
MKRALFIDRDGTLILEPADEQIDSLEKLEFYPEVIRYLGQIARESDFELVMVTNQDGLGTSSFPEDTFWPAHNKMLKTLENEGIKFTNILIDKSFPHENLPTRKPGIGMLIPYLNGAYQMAECFVIGDRITDVQLAKNLGARAILLDDGTKKPELQAQGLEACTDLITTRWEEVYNLLCRKERKAEVVRNTRETKIRIGVNLDGTGKSAISTGIAFFDHMLDQIARHGQLDLEVEVKGDLEVDEHHTIEDTGIALGEAIAMALGNKRGIERYGFALPMDDCLAQVAIDFGGRNWCVWEAAFTREKIGEMPTEMFFHFFKSFSDAARANLNIKAEGQNEHHKIEAIFKAFAKAIKMAKTKEEGNWQLPSTKGVL